MTMKSKARGVNPEECSQWLKCYCGKPIDSEKLIYEVRLLLPLLLTPFDDGINRLTVLLRKYKNGWGASFKHHYDHFGTMRIRCRKTAKDAMKALINLYDQSWLDGAKRLISSFENGDFDWEN